MKGMIHQTKHPIAYVVFWYFIGCSIGTVLGSATLFYYGIDPEPDMAMSAIWMIVATLIALTWGEK